MFNARCLPFPQPPIFHTSLCWSVGDGVGTLFFLGRYPLRVGPDLRPASRGAALSRREEPGENFVFGGPKCAFQA